MNNGEENMPLTFKVKGQDHSVNALKSASHKLLVKLISLCTTITQTITDSANAAKLCLVVGRPTSCHNVGHILTSIYTYVSNGGG